MFKDSGTSTRSNWFVLARGTTPSEVQGNRTAQSHTHNTTINIVCTQLALGFILAKRATARRVMRTSSTEERWGGGGRGTAERREGVGLFYFRLPTEFTKTK